MKIPDISFEQFAQLFFRDFWKDLSIATGKIMEPDGGSIIVDVFEPRLEQVGELKEDEFCLHNFGAVTGIPMCGMKRAAKVWKMNGDFSPADFRVFHWFLSHEGRECLRRFYRQQNVKGNLFVELLGTLISDRRSLGMGSLSTAVVRFDGTDFYSRLVPIGLPREETVATLMVKCPVPRQVNVPVMQSVSV